MMSKKISGSGLLNAAAGIDRGRVGERLRAALAGLEELHFLKEKQRNMVFWALRMDREETLSSNDPSAESPEVETEEQRLEATLTALKQQLSRLRRQDVGLKTHLQELDQQISELKLDACKVSSEHLEADSRPSSDSPAQTPPRHVCPFPTRTPAQTHAGFAIHQHTGAPDVRYVRRKRLLRPERRRIGVAVQLLHLRVQRVPVLLPNQPAPLRALPARPRPPGPYLPRAPGPPEASRRRSADESSAQGEGVRTGGVRLGSAWIRAGASGADRARQRPVSTGDLERMMLPVSGVNGTRTSPGHSQRGPAVDPKYHSNLVSRSGAEVYRYPSPLHAVALQSPIFSLSVDGAPAAAQTPGGAPGAGESPQTTGNGSENRPGVYIHKLLQRSVSRTSLLGDGGRDRAQPPARTHTEVPATISGVPGLTGGPALRPQDPSLHQRQVEMGRELPPESGRTPAAFRCGQDPVNRVGPASVPNHAQEGPCPCRCYPAAPSEPKPRDAVLTSDPSGCVQAEERKSSRADLSSREQPRGAALTRKPSDKRPRRPRGAQLEFVHAQFVPAGAQRVRVKQADRKTKAVRLRKRSSEKPRPSTQHLAHAEVGRDGGDRGPRHPGPARASRKLAHSRGEGSGRSCSETSLCGPAFPRHHSSQPDPALRSGKAHRPHAQEVSLAELARRKQVTRKWSVAEVACQRAQEVSTQAAMRRSGAVPRSVSVRPTSGQWVGHPYPASSSSYLAGFGSRYPAAPFPAGRSRRPPPSESEYSADCASLFHSTIAESSEGELSDFTANRFGDSESSDSRSDSDSSLSLGEEEEEEEEEGGGEEGGGLVWAEAALGPTAAGVTLHPSRSEPPACRIKASRALKKKIRHFEPAALKVMTLVYNLYCLLPGQVTSQGMSRDNGAVRGGLPRTSFTPLTNQICPLSQGGGRETGAGEREGSDHFERSAGDDQSRLRDYPCHVDFITRCTVPWLQGQRPGGALCSESLGFQPRGDPAMPFIFCCTRSKALTAVIVERVSSYKPRHKLQRTDVGTASLFPLVLLPVDPVSVIHSGRFWPVLAGSSTGHFPRLSPVHTSGSGGDSRPQPDGLRPRYIARERGFASTGRRGFLSGDGHTREPLLTEGSAGASAFPEGCAVEHVELIQPAQRQGHHRGTDQRALFLSAPAVTGLPLCYTCVPPGHAQACRLHLQVSDITITAYPIPPTPQPGIPTHGPMMGLNGLFSHRHQPSSYSAPGPLVTDDLRPLFSSET
ncbi:hypothetical protein COCON_G00226200 [Conger conger]|uniref:Uncharacterized protein n=1 Tax=Conger conger TaxID=82655 RepID=A0A9Q1HNK1_CONCO|nr:hypothetical protein COCON_G00226200 [Conger conger]